MSKVQYMSVLDGGTVEDAINAINKVGFVIADVGIFFDKPEDIDKFCGGKKSAGKLYKVTFEEVEDETVD